MTNSSWIIPANGGKRGNQFELQIDAVDFSVLPEKPYSILTNITFVGNDNATKRYDLQTKAGLDRLMKNTIIMHCAENSQISGLMVHLLDNKPFESNFKIITLKENIEFTAYTKIRRLGIYDRKDIVYYYGNIFKRMWADIRSSDEELM